VPSAPVLLAVHAMATRFELVLHGDHAAHLRAAGEHALAEITRADELFSAYRASSDVGRINRGAGRGPVTVTAETCRLIARCVDVSRHCGGAFDVTIGALVRAWRAIGECSELPGAGGLDAAKACVGSDRLLVNQDASTVSLAREGMALDLGAAAKGHAIDTAIDVLREAGVTSALLHGGTSSVHAIGAPPGETAWRVRWAGPGGERRLRDAALSVSAPHGRAFVLDGVSYGHVIDPRTGRPVDHTSAAGVAGPSSFLCDVLSTALLVLGPAALPGFRQQWPEYDAWVNASPEA
jgi:thiamine biosynthesis lipoprotein